MSKQEHLLISFSGGRTSAFMARMIQVSPIYKNYTKHFVYANTGKEKQETLDFIKACQEAWGLPVIWLEAVISQEKGVGTRHKIVSHETAVVNTDKEQPMFEGIIKKYGLPTNAFPFCTRELKDRCIKSYMRSLGLGAKDYKTAIGIRADEAHREGTFLYPLIEMGIDVKVVRDFWDRQPFDLGLKDYEGNCDLCFKKSKKKRLTILKEDPSLGDWWGSQEGMHRGQDVVFDRDGLSIKQLQEIADSGLFNPAKDAHELQKMQLELFDEPKRLFDWEYETDCFCKMELN